MSINLDCGGCLELFLLRRGCEPPIVRRAIGSPLFERQFARGWFSNTASEINQRQRCSYFDDPALDGFGSGLGAVMHVEFLQDQNS
jgi:hypothetical protein